MSASLIHFIDKNILKKQVFTSSGSFVVPKGVTSIFIEGCGGGGGGGRGLNGVDASNQSSGGGGGGSGSPLHQFHSQVTEEDTLTVTIGAGGASQTSGGNSSVTGLDGVGSVHFPGGFRGDNGTLAPAGSPGANGGFGANAFTQTTRDAYEPFQGGNGGQTQGGTSEDGFDGVDYFSVHGGTIAGAAGGQGGTQAGGGYGGGGGGGGASSNFGPGGIGGDGSDNTDNDATVGGNAPSTNYGAGGGGGGGGSEAGNATGRLGGTGANGIVIIYYADAG